MRKLREKTTILLIILIISMFAVGTQAMHFSGMGLYDIFQPDPTSGIVDCSNVTFHSGEYSVYLQVNYPSNPPGDYGYTSDSNEIYVLPYNEGNLLVPEMLADLDSFSFWYYRPTGGDPIPPQVDIWLATAGDLVENEWLLGQIPLATTNNTWVEVPLSDITWIKAMGGQIYGTGSTGLANAKGNLTTARILGYGVQVGSPATRDNDRTMEGKYYIDDIEINGLVFDFEIKPEVWVDDDAEPGWYDLSHFATIQTGINVVAEGGTVNVAAGTYSSSTNGELFPLTINKSLTLKGGQFGVDPTASEARTNETLESVIDATGSIVNAIEITANDVTIDGFTIKNAATDVKYAISVVPQSGDHSIYSSRIAIQNNILTDNNRGMKLVDNENSLVMLNRIVNCNSIFTTQGGSGIVLSYVKSTTLITENLLTENMAGNTYYGPILVMYGRQHTQPMITYNRIVSNHRNCPASWGILVLDSSAIIRDNIIADNDMRGIGTMWGTADIPIILIEDNEITGNSQRGIEITVGTFAVNITRNKILGNGDTGIDVQSGITTDVVVHYNDISGNGVTTGFAGISSPTNPIDATLNWWGTTVEPEIANMVNGPVDYSPWLPASIETYFVDTDGDGFTDIDEINLGTDPNNANDFPGAPIDYIVTETVSGEGQIETDEVDVIYNVTADTEITVAEYEEAPEDESSFSGLSDYLDVHVNDTSKLTSIKITLHYNETDVIAQGLIESELRMYYWTGATWEQCSYSGVNVDTNELWAILNSTSTPDLDYLSGGPFGGGTTPELTLFPDEGISMFLVYGEHFTPGANVILTWDGEDLYGGLPVMSIIVQVDGTFGDVGIVPTQGEPGGHTVNATDSLNKTASATFTVLDLTGPQGPSGPEGDEGDTGPRGFIGPMGPTGPLGPQGETGSQGEAGPQGPEGNATTIAVQGELGPQGEPGSQGEIGPAGAQGETGLQGETGEQGPAGPQGEQGPEGPQGEPATPTFPTVGVVGGTVALSSILAVVISYMLKKRT